MRLATHITRFAASLLLLAAAGSVVASSNANALLGASEPAVLELSDASMSNPTRPALVTNSPLASATSTKITVQRLQDQKNRGFDWSTLDQPEFWRCRSALG